MWERKLVVGEPAVAIRYHVRDTMDDWLKGDKLSVIGDIEYTDIWLLLHSFRTTFEIHYL